MHEIALAKGAFDITLSVAKDNFFISVEKIYFNKAKRSCVCNDLFQRAFEHLAIGSIAEKAEIIINDIDTPSTIDFEITSIEGEI